MRVSMFEDLVKPYQVNLEKVTFYFWWQAIEFLSNILIR